MFVTQHQPQVLVSPLGFQSISLCLQQQINMAVKHWGTAAVTHQPRSPKSEGRWPEVEMGDTVCVLTSCDRPKKQQKKAISAQIRRKIPQTHLFFLAQCNQMMSVSTQLVSFTVQKVSLYTGITVGTEGVEGNAAGHLRATLSNRHRSDRVVLMGFFPNLSYFCL